MAKQRFKIIPFTNPSGVRVWRLSGTLHGERVRRNFADRADAVTERQRLMVRYLNEKTEGQTIWTTLTQDQNQDAVAALAALRRAGSRRSLCDAIDFFLTHHREAEINLLTELAIERYLGDRQESQERGALSLPQLRSIRKELKNLALRFQGRVLSEISVSEVKEYLDRAIPSGAKPSLKTWNNRRGYLSAYFRWCIARKYLGVNPLEDLPQYRIQKARSTAETLGDQQALELMHWLEGYRGRQLKNGEWWGEPGCMVPVFALSLFAGVRPDWQDGEMAKLRPGDVRLDTRVILIEPEVSKVNERRIVKIQPNLRAWLERYPPNRYPIIPRRCFAKMWREVRARFDLGHDVLRHTYISMTVGAFRSVGDAALQAGNSEAVIRKHYLDLKSTEEADRFWRIVPTGMKLTAAMRKKDGRYLAETEQF
jgi:integrase